MLSPERASSFKTRQLGKIFFDELEIAYTKEVFRANRIHGNQKDEITNLLKRITTEALTKNISVISKKHQNYLTTLVEKLQVAVTVDDCTDVILADEIMSTLCAPHFLDFLIKTVHNYSYPDSLDFEFSTKKFFSSLIQFEDVHEDFRASFASSTSKRSNTSFVSFRSAAADDDDDDYTPNTRKKSITSFLKLYHSAMDPTLRQCASHTLLQLGTSAAAR